MTIHGTEKHQTIQRILPVVGFATNPEAWATEAHVLDRHGLAIPLSEWVNRTTHAAGRDSAEWTVQVVS